jgi:hypothetical protein
MNEEDRSHGTPINAVRNLGTTIPQEDWERFWRTPPRQHRCNDNMAEHGQLIR